MKLHLPSGLRAALFACFAAFAGIGTTLSTATITGGVFAAAVAGQAVAETTYTDATSITIDGAAMSPNAKLTESAEENNAWSLDFSDATTTTHTISVTDGTQAVVTGITGSFTEITTSGTGLLEVKSMDYGSLTHLKITEGTLYFTGGEEMFWSNSPGSRHYILEGKEGSIATLQLKSRITMGTNLELNGYSRIEAGEGATTSGANRASVEAFGGTITATGTNNVIALEVMARNGLTINVVGANDTLTFDNGIVCRVSGNGGALTKTGAGTLYINNGIANSMQKNPFVISTGTVELAGTSTLHTMNVNGTEEVKGTLKNVGTTTVAGTLSATNHGIVENVGTLTVDGTLTTAAGSTLENANEMTIGNNGTLSVSGAFENSGALTVNGTLSVSGAFENSGTLTINGALEVLDGAIDNTGGIVSIGTSASMLDGLDSFVKNGNIYSLDIQTLFVGGEVNGVENLVGGRAHTYENGILSITIADVMVEGSASAYTLKADGFYQGENRVVEAAQYDSVTFAANGAQTQVSVTLNSSLTCDTITVASGTTLELNAAGYVLDAASTVINGHVVLKTVAGNDFLRDATLGEGATVELNTGSMGSPLYTLDGLHDAYSGDLILANCQHQIADSSKVWSYLTVKNGATIGINCSYSGDMTISGSCFRAGEDGALKLYNGSEVSGRVTVSAQEVQVPTTSDADSPTQAFAGAKVNVWGTESATISGALLLEGTLAKTGTGTVNVTGGVTGVGALEVQEGTVNLNSSYAAGDISVADGATLTLGSNFYYDGDVVETDSALTSTITVTNAGTVTSNSSWMVQDGKLVLTAQLITHAGGDFTWTDTALGDQTLTGAPYRVVFSGSESGTVTSVGTVSATVTPMILTVEKGAEVKLYKSGSGALQVERYNVNGGTLGIHGNLSTVSGVVVRDNGTFVALGNEFADNTPTAADLTANVCLDGGNFRIGSNRTAKGSIELLGGENTVASLDGAYLGALASNVKGTGNLTVMGSSSKLELRNTFDYTGDLTMVLYDGDAAKKKINITASGRVQNDGAFIVDGAQVEVISGAIVSNTGDIAVKSGTLQMNDGATLSCGGNVTVESGELKLIGTTQIGGDLAVMGGSVTVGGGKLFDAVMQLGDVTLGSGTTLTFHHASGEVQAMDGDEVRKADLTMKGATLHSEDMDGSAVGEGQRWRTLTVEGDNTISYTYKGRVRFEKLQGGTTETANLTIQDGGSASETYITEFELIENLNGSITNSSLNHLVIGTVSQVSGKELTITGGAESSAFAKTGEGKLVVDSLAIKDNGQLTVNYGGAADSLSITALTLGDSVTLTYTSATEPVLALAASLFENKTAMTLDVTALGEDAFKSGFNTGIDSSVALDAQDSIFALNIADSLRDSVVYVKDTTTNTWKIQLIGQTWNWADQDGGNWSDNASWNQPDGDTTAGKELLFGDAGMAAAGVTTITIADDVNPAKVTVSATSGTYVFTGTGGIASGSLEKSGSGTLTLENANTSTGAMTISGGTVNLGSANGAGSWAGDISVTEDGTLHIVNAGSTVGNAITATGAKATIEVDGLAAGVTLAKISGGNLIANTASGNVTITDVDDAAFTKVTNGTGTLTFGTGITMAELDNNGTIKASGSTVTITGGTANGGILDTREGAATPGTVILGGNSTFAGLKGGWVNAGTHTLTLTGDSSIHNFSDGSTNKPTVIVSGGTFEVRDGGTLNLTTLALSAESRLSAAGSVSVEGDVTSTAAVGTLADGLVAGLHASGAVTVGGMVTVDGSIAAGGKVTIGTYADVEGSITSSAAVENAIEIGTNVNVAGSLKAVNADSFADVTSGGNIKIGGNAEVGGDIWANWRVDVEGNATVEGDLLSKIAGIGVKGDAEVGGSLGAVEAVVIGGTATIRGSLSGGNVTLTKGGSIGYLEDGTVNTAAGAGNLTVGAEGTLSLGGALKVAGTISGVTNIVVADNLLPLTNNAPLVQAGSMTVGDSLTLSFTNRQNVLNLGLDGHSSLESENSYTLIAADTALCDASTLEALKAKLTLVAPETSGIIMLAEENSFVHDAVRYTLGVSDDMKSIVIKASYEGCDWVSTDGVWDNSVFDADAGTSDDWAGGRTPSATTDVVFNGNTTGTSSVKLVGDVTAQSVLIDTAATTDGLTAYAFSSDSAATIDTQVLTIKSGELTIGGLVSVGSAADALDSVALDANGALIVAEGGSLYTQAMEVNAQQEVTSLVIPGGEPVTTTRGFFNHGTTVVSGALTVGSGSKMGDPIDRVEIINEGVLKVGSGSVLGAVLGEGSFYATYASAEEVQVDKIDSDGVAGSVGAQHVEAQGAKLMLGAATGSGKEGSALVADSVLVTASGSGIVGSFPAYGELTVNGIVDNFHTISALDGSSVSVTGLADDGLSLAVTNVNALEASGTNSLLNVGETAFLKSVEKGGTTVAPSVTASGKNSHVILAGLALESPATETGKLKAEGENARIDLFGMVVGTYDIELGTGASIAAQGSDLTVNLLSSTGSLSALNNTVTLLQKTSSGGSVDVKSLDLSAASGSTFTSVKTGALTLDLSALWADGTKGQPLLTTGSLERSEVVDSLTLNLGSSFTDAAANLLAVGSTFGAAGVDAANNVAYTDYTLISGASLKDFTFTVENAEDLQQAFALQEAYALVKVENGNLVLRVYDDSEGREWNSDNPGWVGNQNNNSGDVLDVVPGSPVIDATLRVPTYQMFDTVDKVTVSDAYTIDLSATAGADQASELEVGKQLATATDAAAGLLISNLNGTGSLTIKGDGATLAEGGTDINTIDRVTILANELTTAENLSYSGKLTLESVDAIVRSEDGAAVTAGSMELNSAALTNEGLLSTGAVALSGSDSSLTNKNTLTAGDVTLSGAGASLTNEAGTLTAGSVTLSNATATLASTGGTTKVASLNGTAGKIGGTIIVTGTGGNYSGGYDAIAAAPGAEIKLAGGASQALTAGDGLTVSTHGTADDNRAAVTLSGTTMDAINVSHADVTLADMNTLTVQELSSMAGGSLAFKLNAGDVASGVHGTSPVIISSETYMTISGTTLKVTQADTAKQTSTFDVTKGTTGLTLVTLVDGGATALTKEDIDRTDFSGKGDNFFTSEFFNRYFDWESVVVEDGKVKADLVTDYYTKPLALTENGTTGLQMLDIVDLQIDPQGNADKYEDLAGVIGALKDFRASGNADAADRLASAVAGSGVASLGMALAGDVERQLKAIRNRTTTMGVDPSVVNEDMPYFNAWINAEGDHRSLDEDSTYAGYSLSSWGGTIGFDMDVNPSLTWGLALTAMYGDFTAESADVVEGDVSSYYVSAFARAMSGAWVHTFVATVGMSWTDVSRTVSYRGGSYTAEGDADGISFGFLYEVARTFALNEDATACWQPVFNVAFRHTQVDGYTETGSDAALSLGDQTLDTVTFGFGGRVQAVVGENIYNRTSVFEARALIKLDAGDRESEMDTALINASAAKGTVRSAEMDAFGIELGAGITVPVGMESGSIFMDGSIEFRDCYTSANATLGYRVNF